MRFGQAAEMLLLLARVVLAVLVVVAGLGVVVLLRVAWEAARASRWRRGLAAIDRAGPVIICLIGRGVDPGWLFDLERRRRKRCPATN